MAEPTNPQDPNVRRDEPAVGGPQDPELEANERAHQGLPEEDAGVETPAERLEATLSNPATIKAVLEFLQQEGLTLDEVEVEEGFWGWSEGAEIAHITQGSMDFYVSPDDETTTRMAITLVTNDLQENPEIFNQSFIENYIDTDRLKRDLWSDVEEMARENMRESGEEEDDDAVERQVEQELADPMEYLRGIYGNEDAVKQAIRIAGINIHEAAEDAVAADGEGHFLSTYDGNVHDLPGGGQYWRHN